MSKTINVKGYVSDFTVTFPDHLSSEAFTAAMVDGHGPISEEETRITAGIHGGTVETVPEHEALLADLRAYEETHEEMHEETRKALYECYALLPEMRPRP